MYPIYLLGSSSFFNATTTLRFVTGNSANVNKNTEVRQLTVTCCEQRKRGNNLYRNMDMDHSHCDKCINRFCSRSSLSQNFCEVVNCKTGCGARYHSCKQGEHQELCEEQIVPCINLLYGILTIFEIR